MCNIILNLVYFNIITIYNEINKILYQIGINYADIQKTKKLFARINFNKY